MKDQCELCGRGGTSTVFMNLYRQSRGFISVCQDCYWFEQAKTFDEVADLYEAARPGYPVDLADYVISMSGISRGGKILEVGSVPSI